MRQLFKLARLANTRLTAGSLRCTSTAAEVTGSSATGACDHLATSGISWKAVTLGVTAFGFIGSSMAFFSDRAHKDNEATRHELGEDMKSLEDRIDKRFEGMEKRFDKVEDTLKEISASLALSRPPRP
jgi:hypothetical protein